MNHVQFNRRRFIQASSAASVLGLAAGCASTGAGSGGKVVVVGGGYGGATAAKYLRLWSEGRIEVTLVEPNEAFISCPISNLVIGGSRQMADITTSYDNLAKRHGVKIVRDRAATTAPATHAGFVVSVATKPDANRPPAFVYVSS